MEPEAYRSRVASCREELEGWVRSGVLPAVCFQDKLVLDLECGDAAFALAFLDMGARRVHAIDTFLSQKEIPEAVRNNPDLMLGNYGILQYREHLDSLGEKPDLIFINTSSEHVRHLPEFLLACSEVVEHGAFIFLNHDNYYQPVGSHDHGMLESDDAGGIRFLGVPCWEDERKCEASAEHRRKMHQERPWNWDRYTESKLSPEDCSRCPYYRRSQPWAHLLYQEDFARIFPQQGFHTARKRAGLNKVTIFQLRQFVVEAEFLLAREERVKITNQPPRALLEPPFCFHPEDLTTRTIVILARRK